MRLSKATTCASSLGSTGSEDMSQDELIAENNVELECGVEQPNVGFKIQLLSNNTDNASQGKGKGASHLAESIPFINIVNPSDAGTHSLAAVSNSADHDCDSQDSERVEEECPMVQSHELPVRAENNTDSGCDKEDCERVEEESSVVQWEEAHMKSIDGGNSELRMEELPEGLDNDPQVLDVVIYPEDALCRGGGVDGSESSSDKPPAGQQSQNKTTSAVPATNSKSSEATPTSKPIGDANYAGLSRNHRESLPSETSAFKSFQNQFGEEGTFPLELHMMWMDIMEVSPGNSRSVYPKSRLCRTGEYAAPLPYVFPRPLKYPEKYIKSVIRTW